jgi:hypothetical protein
MQEDARRSNSAQGQPVAKILTQQDRGPQIAEIKKPKRTYK